MSIEGLKDWMIYSEKKQTITFLDINEGKVGVFNIQFTLLDSLGAENIIVTTFEVKIPPVDDQIEEETEETEEESSSADQAPAFSGVSMFDESTTAE